MEGEGQGAAGGVARQAERAAGEDQNQQQVLASHSLCLSGNKASEELTVSNESFVYLKEDKTNSWTWSFLPLLVLKQPHASL